MSVASIAASCFAAVGILTPPSSKPRWPGWLAGEMVGMLSCVEFGFVFEFEMEVARGIAKWD